MGCFDQDFQDSQKWIHQSVVLYCSMINYKDQNILLSFEKSYSAHDAN